MIVIYNVSGLLVGAAGVFAGMLFALLSGSVGLGLLVIAAAWIAGGLWWRNSARPALRAYPAIFFIPLPFLAAPVALSGIALASAELLGRSAPHDPRSDALHADEETLKQNVTGGDEALSEKILDALDEASNSSHESDFHVFTRTTPHGVLVLVRISDLKKYPNDERARVLKAIAALVHAEETLADQPLFIGLKGKISYGAILTPPEQVEIAFAVLPTKLYDVYGTNAKDRANDETSANKPGAASEAKPAGDVMPTGDPEALNGSEPGTTPDKNRTEDENQPTP